MLPDWRMLRGWYRFPRRDNRDDAITLWIIGGMASYDHLLEKAREASTPEAFTQLRRQLKAWGLPTRVRKAA